MTFFNRQDHAVRCGLENNTMTPAACLKYFANASEDILATLEMLAAIDSPSGDVDAISRFVMIYGPLLERAGMVVREISSSNGPHVFAEASWAGGEGPPIVLVGHTDTVWPIGESLRRPPRREAGRLQGPGVCDMRAGLTLIAHALRYLHDQDWRPSRPIQVFLSADEEIGSRTAHPHMEALLRRDATAIVLEPPLEDGSLKTRRKGVGMYTLFATGIEAHAGLEPERGASAITEIARTALEVLSWADPRRGITLNVGQLRGGIATNVVAGSAEAGLDVRFDSLEDGERIHAQLQSLPAHDPRTRLRVEGGIIFPPLVPGAASERVARLTIGIARELGLEIATGKAGGGSDGSFLASLGLTVIDGISVEGGGAHARDEHIHMDRVPVRAALLSLLVKALAEE